MPQSDAGVERFDARCPVNQEVGKVTIGYPRDAVCATTKQARLKALFGYCMRLCLVVGLCNHVAFAAEPVDAAAWISGDSSCPDPVAVEAEVSRLTSPEARAQHLPGAIARVFDTGESYRIEITKGGDHFEKSYFEPARECDKRVRVAAVYIVMALIPPELALPDEAHSEPATPSSETEPHVGATAEPAAQPASAPKPAPKATPRPVAVTPATQAPSSDAEPLDGWRIDAALLAQHSISSSQVPKVGALGADLAALFGAGQLRWLLGFDVMAKSHFDIGQVRAETAELAGRTGVQLVYGEQPLELAADVGVVGALRRLKGEAAEASERQTINELGAFVGTSARFRWWSWVSPFVGVQARLFPAPAELVVTPRGQIGTMPKIWVGASIGLRLEP